MKTILQISVCIIAVLLGGELLSGVTAAAQQSTDADLERAQKLLDTHSYDEARLTVDVYLKTHPSDPEAVVIKSDIYSALGEWDRALKALEEGLSADEDNIDLLLALAVVYREKLMRSGMFGKMSNAKKSKNALEKAFQIDPKHVIVRREMVFYLVHAPGFAGGDKGRGGRIALETVELDEAEGRLQLAVVHRQNEEYEESVDQFKQVIELDPEKDFLYFMLGHVYILMSDFLSAEQIFGMYVDKWPEAALPHDGLGDCYTEQKRLDDAIAQYELALDKDAWFGDSRFKVAELYRKRKNYEKAAYHYRRLLELNPGYVDIGKAKKQLRKIEKGR